MTKHPSRVLVMDGHTRAALATVRSLGRAGHTVFVAAPRLPALAGDSKFCSERCIVPPALDQPEAACARVADLVRRFSIEVVLPVTDASMSAVLRAGRDVFAPALVAGPTSAAFETASDKAVLLSRAAQAGLAVPHSVVARTPVELDEAVRTIGYPCVLKPHRSVVAAARASLGVTVLRDEAMQRPEYLPAAYPIVVQQIVRGQGEGLFFLLDRGRQVAMFAHRRLREKPPFGGVSVYRESMLPPPELVAASTALLAPLEWHGVLMLEFKRARDGGPAYLMEINGRLWGSLQLAIDAGVDFPDLLVRLVRGDRVEPVTSYRVGVRSRWFWGDVDHLLLRLRHSRRRLGLDALAPSRGRAVWDFLRFGRGDNVETWDWGDPKPFLRESLDWLRGRSA